MFNINNSECIQFNLEFYFDSIINLYNILLLLKNMKKIDITAMLLFSISIIMTFPVYAQLNQISEITTDGNITSSIKPQGTSIGVQNESSVPENIPNTDTANNITSSIKPQGTSIDNSN